MMAWLGEWIKEIIFIVLFASFIDLILPNRSMERYIKFVVSLLILLTMLTPVMRFFAPEAKQQIDTALSSGLDNWEDARANESTEVILRQGEQLRKKQEEEALQWAGEEAARLMKDQIERETGQPVERVTVRMITEPVRLSKGSNVGLEQLKPSFAEVEVVMAQTESVSGNTSKERTASNKAPSQTGDNRIDNAGTEDKSHEIIVKPVEKVNLNIRIPKVDSSAERNPKDKTGDAMESTAIGTELNESESTITGIETQGRSQLEEQIQPIVVKQIEDILSRDWGVPREAVSVLTYKL